MRRLALGMLLAGCGSGAAAGSGDPLSVASDVAGSSGADVAAVAGSLGVAGVGGSGALVTLGGGGSAPFVSVPAGGAGSSAGGNQNAGSTGKETAGAPQGGALTAGGSSGSASTAGGAGQSSAGATATCNGVADSCFPTNLGCAACVISDCAGYVKQNGSCGVVGFYSVSTGDRIEFPALDDSARSAAKSVALQDCFTKQPSHPILCQ